MEMLATDKAGNVNVKRCGDGHVAEAKFSRLNEESATRRANDLQWVLQTPRKEHLAILPVGVDTLDAYRCRGRGRKRWSRQRGRCRKVGGPATRKHPLWAH